MKNKLCEIGLSDFRFNQGKFHVNLHFRVIKQRIMDIFMQSYFEQIKCSSICKVYMHIIDHFTLQYYLQKLYQSKMISKYDEYVCHHITYVLNIGVTQI